MKNHTFPRYILIIFLLILMALPPLSANAFVPLSFGGRVTAIQPCDEGLLAYTLVPLKGVIPFLWLWGELPFLSYIPPHPGQLLLGLAVPTVAPCTLDGFPMGFGFPIMMHGSSIIP